MGSDGTDVFEVLGAALDEDGGDLGGEGGGWESEVRERGAEDGCLL